MRGTPAGANYRSIIGAMHIELNNPPRNMLLQIFRNLTERCCVGLGRKGAIQNENHQSNTRIISIVDVGWMHRGAGWSGLLFATGAIWSTRLSDTELRASSLLRSASSLLRSAGLLRSLLRDWSLRGPTLALK